MIPAVNSSRPEPLPVFFSDCIKESGKINKKVAERKGLLTIDRAYQTPPLLKKFKD
jgi:hypothetical protein